MFDKVIDFLIDCISIFKFWEVLEEYQQGVVLTLGRPRSGWYNGWREPVVGPGFYLVLPFYIEAILTDNVMVESNVLPSQTLQTADGLQVTVKAAVLWRINNIKTILLKVNGGDKTIHDAVACTIADLVRVSTWAEINTAGWHVSLQDACHRSAVKYGLEVVKLALVDLVRTDLSLRLYQS